VGASAVNVLVTGVTGYLGAAIVPPLLREGHSVRGLAREPERRAVDVPTVACDVVTGHGLRQALTGADIAYYLIHSMEPLTDARFASVEAVAAENFADACVAAGVQRIVYLGGLLASHAPQSAHLASRIEVERILLKRVPDSVALRASIVIGARSRSFRFLVHLVERLPVLALPAWHSNRTQPIDERDIVQMLVHAATSGSVGGLSLDAGGAEIVTYGELIDRIRELMMVNRPTVSFKRLNVTPIASRIAALVAGEQHALIGPLMESLDTDLLARDRDAADLLGVRLHPLNAAIEHAMRMWEESEPLAAR
jgi:uncharacterized protein YbjT (DUF2867 family)